MTYSQREINVPVVEEAVALIALSLIDGVGYWGIRRLIENHGSLRLLLKEAESYDQIDEAFQQAGIRKKLPRQGAWQDEVVAMWERGQTEYRALRSDGVEVLVPWDERFPAKLLDIADPPYWLFVEGKTENLDRNGLALVGTRKPSTEGDFICQYFSRLAALFDCVVVSGLATGIDQLAHQTSLNAGCINIAVMGTGIRETYPQGAQTMRTEIVQSGGTVVSEYLPKQRYSKENFVRRNRIQAGLSSVVVPLEWNEKSGTAHTVNYAIEYGRQLVFPRTASSNSQSAWLVEKARNLGALLVGIPGEESSLLEMFSSIYGRPSAKVVGLMGDPIPLGLFDQDDQPHKEPKPDTKTSEGDVEGRASRWISRLFARK